MTDPRQIAAAIDRRVRQLAVHRLSDSALVEHMIGYMGDLQRLWTSTTDEELAALCEEFPGFLRYATLMENMSHALRTGVGVPTHVKQMTPLPKPLQEAVKRLLSEGAGLERALQERLDEARSRRFRTHAIQATTPECADLNERVHQWSATVRQLMRDLGSAGVTDQGQSWIARAFTDMASRMEQLQKGIHAP